MSFHYVNLDEAYRVHQAITIQAKTKAAIRDFALLHSAIERPKATYFGRDLYPTVFAKAAALLQSLCLNHAFTDGNKRTAWLTTKYFLKINGYHLKSTRLEAADFMVRVDNEKPTLPQISSWLRSHSTQT